MADLNELQGQSSATKEVVRKFYAEAWNKGNLDHVDQAYRSDFRANALHLDTPPPGAEGLDAVAFTKVVINGWRTGFPDLEVSIDQQVAEGDYVATLHTVRGTHQGEYMGNAPTGKSVEVSGITINRIEDGQFAEAWPCWDIAGLMIQLGVVPDPLDAPPGEKREPRPFDEEYHAKADPEDAKAIVRRFYDELWSQGKLDVADELFAPDFAGHAPGGGTAGPEDVKRLVAEWREGVPDMWLEIHAQHAEGSLVATRFSGWGKHTGLLLGIPATGKDARLSGIAITRIVDGKVVSDWGEFDIAAMFAELGVSPPSAGSDED
jgi:predicted ester cyclase